MSKVLMKATVTAALIAGAIAPVASAYNVPGAPGTPGGKPTAATGGSSGSKGATGAAANSIAGYTGLELALRTPAPSVFFPRAGKMNCTLAAGSFRLGTGNATKDSSGRKNLDINLSNNGRSYLYNHNGSAIAIKVTCQFVPRNGKKATSAATVVTDA
jgi:hypothetical protein